MSADTRTHKNEDGISILLPAFDHLLVFILCNVGVYGEELSRAVTKAGFPLQWLTRCRLGLKVAVAIYYRHYEIGEDRSNLRVIHLGLFPASGSWRID